MYVNLFLQNLCDELKVANDLNVRIFKVQKRFWNNETKIINYHIEESTNAISSQNSLIFRHIKRTGGNLIEGVVGLCYNNKQFTVDYNALNAHMYTLTVEQKLTVGRVTFCCATPILRKNKIRYIVSLDSRTIKVKLNKTMTKARVDSAIEKNLEKISTTFDEFIL